MSTIVVTLEGGKRVAARVGTHVVRTDQPEASGGEDTAPDPFTLFLASLATCAGFYVQAFCAARSLSTEGISLELDAQNEGKRLSAVTITVHLPESFPARYARGVEAAAAACKVKKALADPPTIAIVVRQLGSAANDAA